MRPDTGIGLGLLAFCGVLYWQTGAISTPPFVPIGPAFYPRVLLVLLAGLAVWLFVENILRGRGPSQGVKKPEGPPPNYRRVLLGFFVFLAYVASLNIIGYMTSTFLFILGLSWSIGPRDRRGLPKLVAVACGTALVIYLVFEKYLFVFLPRGLLF
jgi:putative tricarboxylic transport membrane protein